MAIALIGFGAPVLVSPAAQTMEVPLHASTADDHYVICFAGAVDNVALSTPETGVDKIHELQVTGSGGDRVSAVFGKIASSEPANWTIDLAGGTDKFMRGVAATFSGVDATTPIVAVNSNSGANSDTHATPALNTVVVNTHFISYLYALQVTGSSRTHPSGYTEHIDTGAASMLAVASKAIPAQQVETPGVWSGAGTGADHVGISVVLRPAGGGIALLRHHQRMLGAG